MTEHLRLPKFDAADRAHRSLAALGLTITRRTERGGSPTAADDLELDRLVRAVFKVETPKQTRTAKVS